MEGFVQRVEDESKKEVEAEEDPHHEVENVLRLEAVREAGEDEGDQQRHGENSPCLEEGEGLGSGVLSGDYKSVFSRA